MAQFVPLKVDVSTSEYQALARKHTSEGNTIPKIYLIRADGTKLYAKSGSLSGDQLPTLMVAAIREMGRPLAVGEIKILEEINKTISSAIEKDEFKTVAVQFNKLKKLGTPGAVDSFAKSAIENNQLAAKFTDKVNALIKEYSSGLDSENNLISAIKALMLKNDVGSMSTLRTSLNELEKQVRSSLKNGQSFTEVKSVALAIPKLQHSSDNIKQRAAETIQQFAELSQDEPTRSFLTDLVKESGASVSPSASNPNPETAGFRVWKSSDNRFSVKAKLLELNGDKVQLQKEDGSTITVPLDRLSENDQEFLKKKNQGP